MPQVQWERLGHRRQGLCVRILFAGVAGEDPSAQVVPFGSAACSCNTYLSGWARRDAGGFGRVRWLAVSVCTRKTAALIISYTPQLAMEPLNMTDAQGHPRPPEYVGDDRPLLARGSTERRTGQEDRSRTRRCVAVSGSSSPTLPSDAHSSSTLAPIRPYHALTLQHCITSH